MIQEPGAGSLGAAVAAAIDKDWQSFKWMAAAPSVQTFCGFESRYDDQLQGASDPSALMRFISSPKTIDAELAGRLLHRAQRRTDLVVQALVTAYCTHRGLPLPDEADTEATWEVLAQILSRGIAGLEECFRHTDDLLDEELRVNQQGVRERLAATLMMIAARARTAVLYSPTEDASIVGTAAPQQEIDATVDEALRGACERIMRGRRHPLTQAGSAADRAFAGCVNTVRAMYRQGGEPDFQLRLFNSPLMDQLAESDRRSRRTEQDDVFAHQRRVFEMFIGHVNGPIGTTYSYPGATRLNRQMIARESAWSGVDAATRVEQIKEVYLLLARIHSTRYLVDRIADGTLRYSEIMRAMMQLALLPLQTQSEAEELEETLDWEVLPADVFGPREKPHAPPGLRTAVPLDWARIGALRALAGDWEGAYIVRGVRAVAGSAFKTEYYVLVLPDATGREHAVADSPIVGRGLYVFRAEQGDRFSPALTWREVFSQQRGWPVKRLGALCLLHVKTLPHNLLDALTCPPDEIEQRRLHRLSRGKQAPAAA